MQFERLVFPDDLGMAQQLFDGREQQRRTVRQLTSYLPRLDHPLTPRHDVIRKPPVLGFGGVHPAACHEELDGHVIGDAAP